MTNVNFSNSKIFFNNASLIYNNDHFEFVFDPINKFFKRFEVYLNDVKIMNLKNIKTIQSIPLNLTSKDNRVKILTLENNNQKIYYFNINMKEFIFLDDKMSFSFNELIDDYQKIISFKQNQYLTIDDYEYEIKNQDRFINLNKVGYFKFNNLYQICEEINLIIFNKGIYEDLNYNQGYHFNLRFEKKSNAYYLKFDSINELSKPFIYEEIAKNELFIPIEMKERIIDCQICIKSIYKSGIDIYFDVVFNIEDIYVNDNDEFIFQVFDIENFDEYSFEYKL